MKYVKLSACLSLLAVVGWSPWVQAEAGWLPPTKLSGLAVTAQGRYLLDMPVEKNLSGCSSPGKFYIDFTSIGAQSAYELLLRSMLAERAVELYVTGRCALQGVAEVSAVRLPARP